jgi:N-acetylglutamate synthase-like GNAT family acetyltransferase
MSSAISQVRRATIDDLPALRQLWEAAGLPVTESEKRLIEFQVIFSEDGTLIGCLGLQISGEEGQLHSEVYLDLAIEDAVRQRLWERMQSVARNHSLYRIWIAGQPSAWASFGFAEPTPEQRAKAPSGLQSSDLPCFVLSLRPEPPAGVSVERELALFKQSLREESENARRQARLLKLGLGFIGVLLLIGGLAAAIYVMQRIGVSSPRRKPR